MRKYLIVSNSMNIGINIIGHLNLKQNECYLINNINYRDIFSINEDVIVIQQDKEYKIENFKKLNKELKMRIFKYFELRRKKEFNRLKRLENKKLLKFNFVNSYMLKEGDTVLFRIKETPNNYGKVENINGELFLNKIRVKDIDEMIYGSIRVIERKEEINYYKLSEMEGYRIYNEKMNFGGKAINRSMEKLLKN